MENINEKDQKCDEYANPNFKLIIASIFINMVIKVNGPRACCTSLGKIFKPVEYLEKINKLYI